MMKLRIKYDPYHMKTSISINERDVMNSEYDKIRNFVQMDIPLQSWLDPIGYKNWRGLLVEVVGNTGENKVECEFVGRELDFNDLKQSFEEQKKKENNGKTNITVIYKPEFIYEDKKILEKVDTAYKLIQSDDFKKIIEDKIFDLGQDSQLVKEYNALEEKYKAARDSEFRIVFSGMYTCGKSTIINAILGKEILPTCDGTCTSKIFKISHDPSVQYARMSCIDADGNIVVKEREYTAESLKVAFERMFPRGKKR